ncbi:MAG TPA: hypothetical protein V6D02_11040, partial [Candidatus Obscuribacterales bacterium]
MTADAFNLKILLEILGSTFAETPKLIIFALSLLLSLLVGRFTPLIVQLLIRRFSKEQVAPLYDSLIAPLRGAFQLTGTMLLVSLSLVWLQPDHQSFHDFLNPFVDLAVIGTLAWLTSRLFGRTVRIYGVELLKKIGREVDEMLLVFETIANVIIGFIA